MMYYRILCILSLRRQSNIRVKFKAFTDTSRESGVFRKSASSYIIVEVRLEYGIIVVVREPDFERLWVIALLFKSLNVSSRFARTVVS